MGAQRSGELFGPGVQLCVREAFGAATHGFGVRRPLGLFFDPLMNRRDVRQRLVRVVPVGEHALASGLVEKREFFDAQRRVAGRGLQQAAIVRDPSFGRRRLPQIAVAVAADDETAAVDHDVAGEVVRGEARRQRHQLRARAAERRQLDRPIQIERRREHRRAAQVSVDLDVIEHPAERPLLVIERVEHGFAHAVQQFAERPLAVDAQPHRQHVRAEPRDRRIVLIDAARHRHADGDVGRRARQAVEQGRVAGQQRHEHRAAVRGAQRLQRRMHRLWQRADNAEGSEGLHRRTRMIQRQIERRQRSRERVLPVLPMRLRRRRVEPCRARLQVVAVARRRCQLTPASVFDGRIRRAQFLDQDPHRPAVRDDVMAVESDDGAAGRERPDAGAHERTLLKIKWLGRFGLHVRVEGRGAVCF